MLALRVLYATHVHAAGWKLALPVLHSGQENQQHGSSSSSIGGANPASAIHHSLQGLSFQLALTPPPPTLGRLCGGRRGAPGALAAGCVHRPPDQATSAANHSLQGLSYKLALTPPPL
jgi:hypothetical protein